LSAAKTEGPYDSQFAPMLLTGVALLQAA
jgi:hypothetical protein